jgi:hypothetical protein
MNRTIAFFIAISLLASSAILHAQTPADTGAAAYIAGIEALERADYATAIPALTKAIAADGDNGSYHRARGVAYTLSESFADAITDLKRAQTIDPDDTEARLWIAAAYRMSGDVATGAANFTMRDLPHGYANMVYNVMAMEYWQSRYQGSYYDPATKQRVQASGAVKTLFPDAARAYAQRNRATGAAAAQVITAQLNDAIKNGDWALALRDAVQLRANAPDDPDLRGSWAQALIGAGDALHAREEFTRTLCVKPLWADGYVGRAQAHMILGDQPRADADLAVAVSLGAGTVDDLRRQLSKFIAAPPSDDAVQRFEAAVQADAPFAELVDDALAVHRWTNIHRLRYDESYQQRILLLSEAMRDHAGKSDYPEMLARFLYNFYQVPVIWNGPRGGGQQLRPQSTVERGNELQHAIGLCDASLKIDPNNASTMATEGWLLVTIKALGAEDLADRGLAIDPDNIRLLKLKTLILLNRAGDFLAEAGGLRAGHSDTHREDRADGVYMVTTHYAPTADELAQAAKLEAQAAELKIAAAKLQDHEKQVEDEITALQKQGQSALDAGDLPAARKALTAAYARDPDLQQTLVQLADLCKREGDAAQSQIYSLLSQTPQETTAAEELKSCWDAVQRTQWKTAADAALGAAEIDPADARADAYRSVIAADADSPDATAARRWRTAALALEEARARLMGTTLLADNIPAIDLLNLQESGLAMDLRLQAGNAARSAGQSADAITEFSANVSLEKRLDPQLRVQLIPTAMLPDPAAAAGTVPTTPTIASLLGWSRLGMAGAYLDLHQPAGAQAQYTALRAYLANWPATDPNRDSMNVVDSWARLGQAEAAYAARDYQGTMNILTAEGWPFGLPAALESRRKELTDIVQKQLGGQAFGGVQQQMNQSPDDARAQALQQEITALQKQRDTMAADLNNPNLSARDVQVRQSSISQLDTLIAQQKAALRALQQGR